MTSRTKHRWLIAVAVMLLLAALLDGDMRTRAYVRLHHQELEAFAAAALESPSSDGALQYGQWEASCYPEKGMVEFLPAVSAWRLPRFTRDSIIPPATNTSPMRARSCP